MDTNDGQCKSFQVRRASTSSDNAHSYPLGCISFVVLGQRHDDVTILGGDDGGDFGERIHLQ